MAILVGWYDVDKTHGALYVHIRQKPMAIYMVGLDTLGRTLYGYVGHSPSDSAWLCWTHSVGLCMVMLDTLRRTPYGYVGHTGLCMVMLDTLRWTLYGYVGHTPSDSVWLCWTLSVGLWRFTSDSGVACATPDLQVWWPSTWCMLTFGGCTLQIWRSGVAPATPDLALSSKLLSQGWCGGFQTFDVPTELPGPALHAQRPTYRVRDQHLQRSRCST